MMIETLPTICLVWPYFGLQYYDRFSAVKNELHGIANVVVIALSNRSATYPFWKDTYPHVEYCFLGEEWESMEPRLLYNAVYQKLNQFRPAAVFSHSYSTIDARACLTYCFEENARLCIMSDSKADDFERVWWKEAIKRLIVNGADGMLVPSVPSVDYYRQLGFRGPVFIGYDSLSKSSVLDRVCWEDVAGIQREFGSFLICVARPLPRKCVPELIAAWRRAVPSNTKLLVLGGAPSEYGVAGGEDVRFVGQTSQEGTYNYIAASCGLILPSSQDQWGNVVSEALVLGKRVIVSEGCGVSSIITDKALGYIFKKNDWSALQAAIEIFLNEGCGCVSGLPIPIRIETFVFSVQTFFIDSYRSSKFSKTIAKYLLKIIMALYPRKTYL